MRGGVRSKYSRSRRRRDKKEVKFVGIRRKKKDVVGTGVRKDGEKTRRVETGADRRREKANETFRRKEAPAKVRQRISELKRNGRGIRVVRRMRREKGRRKGSAVRGRSKI